MQILMALHLKDSSAPESSQIRVSNLLLCAEVAPPANKKRPNPSPGGAAGTEASECSARLAVIGSGSITQTFNRGPI